MNDFFPAAIAVAVIVAVFLFGYFTDPYRTKRDASARTADNSSALKAPQFTETLQRSSDAV